MIIKVMLLERIIILKAVGFRKMVFFTFILSFRTRPGANLMFDEKTWRRN